MQFAWAITGLIGIYYVGTIINTKTGGRLGTALVSFILMMLGFWLGILPKDMIQTADLEGAYALFNLTILVNVGTTFRFGELKRQWRLLLIGLAGITGMALLVLGLGGSLFGRKMGMVCFPGLLGGAVAINIMSQAAIEKGLMDLAAMVILIQATQGLLGIPLIGSGVREECRYLAGEFRLEVGAGENAVSNAKEDETVNWGRRIPEKYKNPIYYLLTAALCGALARGIAVYTAEATNGVLGEACVGILVGAVLCHLGFLERSPLEKTGLMPFFMFVMITQMRIVLADLSFQEVLRYLIPLTSMLILAALGMGAAGIYAGRKLGYRKGMIQAFLFGCFAGYPLNYQVAVENIQILAKSPQEEQYLKDKILPTVVLGSIFSVSIASILIAGFLAQNL